MPRTLECFITAGYGDASSDSFADLSLLPEVQTDKKTIPFSTLKLSTSKQLSGSERFHIQVQIQVIHHLRHETERDRHHYSKVGVL